MKRGARPPGVIFVSSMLGGALLSFGGAMYVMVGGGTVELLGASVPGLHKLVAAGVFPVGLSMVVFTGTDLLTSNFMYHSLPFLTVRTASHHRG